uniref:Uncharacterized protein n=1 Tax=Ascaris lumbricoides TaxID=6252 RepID=A0A0M3HTC2_ASCLU
MEHLSHLTLERADFFFIHRINMQSFVQRDVKLSGPSLHKGIVTTRKHSASQTTSSCFFFSSSKMPRLLKRWASLYPRS